MMQFPSGVNPRYGYFGAAIIAYYAFVGFKTSANVAEESQEPYKRFLAAPFGALCVADLVCVLVGLAAGVALPADQRQIDQPVAGGGGSQRFEISTLAVWLDRADRADRGSQRHDADDVHGKPRDVWHGRATFIAVGASPPAAKTRHAVACHYRDSLGRHGAGCYGKLTGIG